MNWINQIKNEINNIDTSNKAIFKFGILIFIVFNIFGMYLYISDDNSFLLNRLFLIGFCLLIISKISPIIIKPIYKLWMLFGYILGEIISRLILSLLFYFVVTPIGILLRVSGKDILNEKIDKSSNSYWIKRDLTNDSINNYKKMY